VPFNGAELPTAFRATVQDLGPSADTYNLTFSDVPAGFTVLDSTASLTVPGGQTGNVGIYLVPNGSQPLPPPGTQPSFNVTATSSTTSSITQTQTETFTVPAIGAVSLTSDPTSLSSSPGVATTATLTLVNDGNVSETVSLSAATPSGLTAGSLPNLTLAPGASQTETVTLTPDASAPLNQSLEATITASYGPSASPVTTGAVVDLLVRSTQTVAVSQAAVAANSASNTGLTSVLLDLADTLASLQTSASAALFAEAQTDLGNLNTLLAIDPALASFTSQVQPLIAAAQSGNLNGVLANAAGLFNSITGVLNQEAAEQFTATLSPSEADLPPGQGQTFTLQLANTGSDAETLNLSVGNLPSGATAQLGQSRVSLAPGASASVSVTLTQSIQSSTIFTIPVTASATVVSHVASAVVSIRPAVADVVSVTASPSSVNSGQPVSASAEVFNTANATRSLLAQVEILDASGTVVATPPAIPVALAPGAGGLTVSLGQIPTTGLADGIYTLQVAMLTSDGSPLPGRSSETDFEVGVPVTASASASATVVAPGTSTVTTTISVTDTSSATGPIPTTTFTLGDIEAFYDSKESQALVGVGQLDGTVFAISNASAAPITDAILTVTPPGGPEDSFSIGTIPAGALEYLQPGISNDGGTNHTFFKVTGTLLDESELGPNTNDVQFEFTGTQGSLKVDSGVFTPAATAGPSNDGTVPDLNFLGGPGNLDESLTDGFGPKVVAHLTTTPANGGNPPPSLPVTVEVGYADNLRANPFFPNPWNGSPNTIFDGYTSTAPGAYDSGAIRVINTSGASITVSGVTVTRSDGVVYKLWGTDVVPAGDSLILTQPGGAQNFDSSDYGTLPYPLTYPDGETLHAAKIDFMVNGVEMPTFLDTGHVLTTGGSDLAAQGKNESQNWRPIGTTGISNPEGLTSLVTVTHNLPASGYAVDSTSISPATTTSSTTQLVWDATILPSADAGPNTFQVTGTVANMDPGEVRQISTGTNVSTTYATATGQQLTASIALAPLTVADQHIISLTPGTETADLGSSASFTVQLTNPYSTDVTYDLSTVGLGGFTTTLASSVTVPAGQTVTTPLDVSIPLTAAAVTNGFEVLATTTSGVSDSVEGELTVADQVALQTRVVSLAISPTQATAGEGTSATYQLSVTNVGSVDDTYSLITHGLAAGVTATLGQNTVDVPPGASNFRDVPLTLAVAPGTTPGSYSFTVTATSTSDPTVASTTNGTLTVTAGGVQVVMQNPTSGVPGTTFQAKVTNTGTTTDTYNLALGGPAALVSSLGTNELTLAPGASQVVPITTGAVNFGVPGTLSLTAMATSTSNPAIQGADRADLNIAASQPGVTAAFSPTSQTLSGPGTATFLLTVHNTGNTEDSYSATIMTTSGLVTATLIGPDGSPTQSIPIFRLSGLSTGTLELRARISAVGLGTVTVLVKSLNHPDSATPTAVTVVTPAAVTPTPAPTVTPTPTSTGGPQVRKVQRFGFHTMPTTLVVTFSQALDPSTAEDVHNYRIVSPDGHRIKVRRAVYDPSSLTVTLHLAERLSVHHPYRFTVIGTEQGGLSNPQRQLLDSQTSGQFGTDYHLELTWRQLVLGHVSRQFLIRYHIEPRGTAVRDRSRDSRAKAPAQHAIVHSTGLFARSVSFPGHHATRSSHGRAPVS
jgi:uncharacterized membrane protein